eukprot:COSAG01_NODE_715_length_14093_cov_64.209233_10_plen_44_part_00
MLPSSVNTSISYSAGWPLVLTTATTATEEGGVGGSHSHRGQLR